MARAAKVLGWCLASLLLLVAGLTLFLLLFDWNLLRPTLNARVSAALDRPFAIEGNLAVVWQREPEEGNWRAWVPWPHFSAEQLSLGNPEWAKGEAFVSLDRVQFRLAPLPLLWKTVHIPRIDLRAPSASLERLADGRSNWSFDLGGDDPQTPSPWTLDIGTIAFDKGRVTLDDQSLQTRGEVLVDPLGQPIPFSDIVGKGAADKTAEQHAAAQDYAFAWQAKGRYKGLALDGSGKVGGLLALQDARRPFPLQADIRAGSTRIVLAGTLTDPQNLGALDLRLRQIGSSLGNLYPLTGVTLPDTPAYATEGRLSAQLQGEGGARFRYEDFMVASAP